MKQNCVENSHTVRQRMFPVKFIGATYNPSPGFNKGNGRRRSHDTRSAPSARGAMSISGNNLNARFG